MGFLFSGFFLGGCWVLFKNIQFDGFFFLVVFDKSLQGF